MATKARKSKDVEIFTTSTGLQIQVKPVDPAFLQRVLRSVEIPKRPTYEAKTFSGRVERHPLDAESAGQTEGGDAKFRLRSDFA